MSTMVFFLNRLREDTSPEAYERFLIERDYPVARTIPSIDRYRVVRVDGPLGDDPVPFDYLEIVEVTDLDTYREDLRRLPGREAFVTELARHVGQAVAIHGTVVE